MSANSAPEASTCRYCGASIIWARNARSGKPMPFDPHTRDGGTGWSLAWRGTGADAEVVARYVRDTNLPLREPHWTTCPNFKRDGEGRTAPKHSAGGGVKPEAEPKQRDFRLDTPRDPVLAKLYGVPA